MSFSFVGLLKGIAYATGFILMTVVAHATAFCTLMAYGLIEPDTRLTTLPFETLIIAIIANFIVVYHCIGKPSGKSMWKPPSTQFTDHHCEKCQNKKLIRRASSEVNPLLQCPVCGKVFDYRFTKGRHQSG